MRMYRKCLEVIVDTKGNKPIVDQACFINTDRINERKYDFISGRQG